MRQVLVSQVCGKKTTRTPPLRGTRLPPSAHVLPLAVIFFLP